MHLILIDSSSWLYRDHYGRSATTNANDGSSNHAISGFCERLWKLRRNIEETQATHCAMVFDAPGPTFRHKMFASYKANRPEKPQDIRDALRASREAVDAFGIARMEVDGFEADDIIATLAALAVAEGTVDIWSPDKDTLQLVRDGIRVMAPKNTPDGRRLRIYDAHQVETEFGVSPALIPSYLALVGDASDGIPGIDKIGPKRAVAMLKGGGPTWTDGKTAGNYTLYRELATLRTDVPGVTLADAAVLPMQRFRVANYLTRIDHPALLRQIRRETR